MITFLGIDSVVKAEEETNIVKNPSFEQEGAKGMPAGWRKSLKVKKEDLDKLEMRLSTEAHSEVYSAYIKRTLDEEKPKGSSWVQRLKLSPDTTYKASCWMKADIKKGRAGTIFIVMETGSKEEGNYKYYQKSGSYNYASGRGTFDWRYYELTFTTPEEPMKKRGSYISLGIFQGDGEVWIDDVKIVEVKEQLI